MIVMEYAENGSLHQLLHSPRYSRVTYNLANALNWALQTAKGKEEASLPITNQILSGEWNSQDN